MQLLGLVIVLFLVITAGLDAANLLFTIPGAAMFGMLALVVALAVNA